MEKIWANHLPHYMIIQQECPSTLPMMSAGSPQYLLGDKLGEGGGRNAIVSTLTDDAEISPREVTLFEDLLIEEVSR